MDEDETKTHTSKSTITCQKHEGKLELKRGFSLFIDQLAIWSMDSTLLK
jgi:hypothetical protein